ncbi:hypothetical protein IPN35_00770 [Candidatus Peregrinibacteria bacterium]|nr:MAG: hypothetical protein IPN35_00770 [Candidatus Peregrinibacteria bacterium]
MKIFWKQQISGNDFRETRLVFEAPVGTLENSPPATTEAATKTPETIQRLKALKEAIQKDGITESERTDLDRIQRIETQLTNLNDAMLQEIGKLEEKYGLNSLGPLDKIQNSELYKTVAEKVKNFGLDLFNDILKPIILSLTGGKLFGGIARKFILDIESKNYEDTIKKVFPNGSGDLLQNKEKVLGYWSIAMKNTGEGQTAESFEEFLKTKFTSSKQQTPSLTMFCDTESKTPAEEQDEKAKKEYEKIFTDAIPATEMDNLLKMAHTGNEEPVKEKIQEIVLKKLTEKGGTNESEITKKVTEVMTGLVEKTVKELAKKEIMKDLQLTEVNIISETEMKELKLKNGKKLGFTLTRESDNWKFTYPAKDDKEAVSATLASGKNLEDLFETMNSAKKTTMLTGFFSEEANPSGGVVDKIRKELGISGS